MSKTRSLIILFVAVLLTSHCGGGKDLLSAEDRAHIERIKEGLRESERGDIIECQDDHVEVIYSNMSDGKKTGYVTLEKIGFNGNNILFRLSTAKCMYAKRIVKKSDPEWIPLIKRYHSDNN